MGSSGTGARCGGYSADVGQRRRAVGVVAAIGIHEIRRGAARRRAVVAVAPTPRGAEVFRTSDRQTGIRRGLNPLDVVAASRQNGR